MDNLQLILRFVREHGFVAGIVRNAVEIEIPYVNTSTDEHGTDVVRVTTYKQARIALGY